HAVVATDVGNDGVVKTVATDTHTAFVDHAAERDHTHLGGAATDVGDHGARGFGHRQTCADGCGHGLFNQIHLGGTGTQRRFADGTALDLGRTARHTDDDAWAGAEHRARVHHLDELLEHLLGDGEIGDDTVFHRA